MTQLLARSKRSRRGLPMSFSHRRSTLCTGSVTIVKNIKLKFFDSKSLILLTSSQPKVTKMLVHRVDLKVHVASNF